MTGIIIRQIVICLLCAAIGYVLFPFMLERKVRKRLELILKPGERCECPLAAILIDDNNEISWINVLELPDIIKNTEENE